MLYVLGLFAGVLAAILYSLLYSLLVISQRADADARNLRPEVGKDPSASRPASLRRAA